MELNRYLCHKCLFIIFVCSIAFCDTQCDSSNKTIFNWNLFTLFLVSEKIGFFYCFSLSIFFVRACDDKSPWRGPKTKVRKRKKPLDWLVLTILRGSSLRVKMATKKTTNQRMRKHATNHNVHSKTVLFQFSPNFCFQNRYHPNPIFIYKLHPGLWAHSKQPTTKTSWFHNIAVKRYRFQSNLLAQKCQYTLAYTNINQLKSYAHAHTLPYGSFLLLHSACDWDFIA